MAEPRAVPGSSAGVAAILFDIDGTLISTGGASDRAWHRAFLELYGVEVNVPDYTGKGVPDPVVGPAVLPRRDRPRARGRRDGEADDAAPAPPGGGGLSLGRLPGDAGGRGHCRLLGGGPPGWADHRQHRGRGPHQALPGGLNRFFSFGGYGSDAHERTESAAGHWIASRCPGGRLDLDGSIAVGDAPLDVEAAHGPWIGSSASPPASTGWSRCERPAAIGSSRT